MTQTFQEKWLAAVDKKGTTLCAGMDPPEFETGRKNFIPQGIHKRDYALRFLKAVAPRCAAVKPNQKFWDGKYDAQYLDEIGDYAQSLGLVVIYDCKAADIGASNDEQFLHAQNRRFDAVTLACYAGNMSEAAQQCRNRNLGGIHMCLMSNPDYKREKGKLVPITDSEIGEYDSQDTFDVSGISYVPQYMQLAHDAKKFGLEGVVVGAPSEKNHIKSEEIARVSHYTGPEMLILVPGIGGKQGGDAKTLYKHFPGNRIIANIASGLMFPNGPGSTPEEQAAAAKQYFDEINSLRAVA
ncbi:MAG: orotidine 5'-phosphate decarboxylase / HUMPS family protein [Nanoarchaeota archaeon]